LPENAILFIMYSFFTLYATTTLVVWEKGNLTKKRHLIIQQSGNSIVVEVSFDGSPSAMFHVWCLCCCRERGSRSEAAKNDIGIKKEEEEYKETVKKKSGGDEHAGKTKVSWDIGTEVSRKALAIQVGFEKVKTWFS
jgi:hypothetical protein